MPGRFSCCVGPAALALAAEKRRGDARKGSELGGCPLGGGEERASLFPLAPLLLLACLPRRAADRRRLVAAALCPLRNGTVVVAAAATAAPGLWRLERLFFRQWEAAAFRVRCESSWPGARRPVRPLRVRTALAGAPIASSPAERSARLSPDVTEPGGESVRRPPGTGPAVFFRRWCDDALFVDPQAATDDDARPRVAPPRRSEKARR